MVETPLLTSDIETGKQVVGALDAESAGLRSALWLYISDSSEWRLVLSFPAVDRGGLRAGYRFVQRTLAKHGVDLLLRRIDVMGVAEPLTRRLRRYVRTPARGTSDITIQSENVDGYLIEGAHVYRST